MTYAIVGHFTPTDAEIQEIWPGQEGRLDRDVTVALYKTHAAAEADLEFYPDGVLVKADSLRG